MLDVVLRAPWTLSPSVFTVPHWGAKSNQPYLTDVETEDRGRKQLQSVEQLVWVGAWVGTQTQSVQLRKLVLLVTTILDNGAGKLSEKGRMGSIFYFGGSAVYSCHCSILPLSQESCY